MGGGREPALRIGALRLKRSKRKLQGERAKGWYEARRLIGQAR